MIVGSITIHSFAEDIIEIEDEAKNLEKETYELLSDSDEEDERNGSVSSEDVCVNPDFSNEEDMEMVNTAPAEDYVVISNPEVGNFKLAKLKTVLTNPDERDLNQSTISALLKTTMVICFTKSSSYVSTTGLLS